MRSEAAVVISLTVLAAVLPLVTVGGILLGGTVGVLALTAIALRRRMVAASSLGVALVAVLVLGLIGLSPQQAVFAVALAAYGLVIARVPWLRPAARWMEAGATDLRLAAPGAAFGLLAGLAVWAWYAGRRAELADLAEMVPDWPVWILIPAGVGFAVINSVLEEAVYRGVMQDALASVLGSGAVSLTLQAAAFATLHFQAGFPRGIIGIGLAFLYGLVLGVLRRRSGGLAVPVLTHLTTDLVIVWILLSQVA